MVSDNRPAYKSDRFARFIAARPAWPASERGIDRLRPTASSSASSDRTSTNTSTALEIASGVDLGDECERCRLIYNEARPSQALDLVSTAADLPAEPMAFEDERVFVESPGSPSTPSNDRDGIVSRRRHHT